MDRQICTINIYTCYMEQSWLVIFRTHMEDTCEMTGHGTSEGTSMVSVCHQLLLCDTAMHVNPIAVCCKDVVHHATDFHICSGYSWVASRHVFTVG